ncbi:MAG: hypothetical protein ABI384_09595, partial [Allobranchiibius sp.]
PALVAQGIERRTPNSDVAIASHPRELGHALPQPSKAGARGTLTAARHCPSLLALRRTPDGQTLS